MDKKKHGDHGDLVSSAADRGRCGSVKDTSGHSGIERARFARFCSLNHKAIHPASVVPWEFKMVPSFVIPKHKSKQLNSGGDAMPLLLP